MEFVNYTPFPALGWPNFDKDNNYCLTITSRVKYNFDKVDTKGVWSLKLDPEQGELFFKDIFYDEENMHTSSVRFESDFVPYKPHGDLIVNAYAHSSVPLREWRCGVKVLRPSETHTLDDEVLLEKWLRVHGERYIQDDVVGYSFTKPKESTKVALRYENANGGDVRNPNFDKEHDAREKEFLMYSLYNPIGVGIAHKELFVNNASSRAPQIESMKESIHKPNMQNPAQGFGFIVRTWHPRVKYVGMFEQAQIDKKEPCFPKNFDERYYNAAHPDLQLKGYFEPNDKIVLYNLVKDRYEQSFKLPNFYFKGNVEEPINSNTTLLNIDTVIVDILEDDMQKNAVYVNYRMRIPCSRNIKGSSLNMLVPEDFIGDGNG